MEVDGSPVDVEVTLTGRGFSLLAAPPRGADIRLEYLSALG